MLRLTSNKVAIQGIPDSDKSEGGLWIPDVAKERTDQGIVKYIGPDVKTVKPGDYVLFGGYDGTTIRLEGEGFLVLMREPFIKCVIERPDTEVDGLYFRAKSKPINQEIRESLINLQAHFITYDEAYNEVIKVIGNYIADTYFPATYEMAVQLITESITPLTSSNKYFVREDPKGDQFDPHPEEE